MERSYEPNPKHKEPKGFGTLCPGAMPRQDVALLLNEAVAVDNALWAVAGAWCFKAFRTHPHGAENHVWHGFSVVGGDVPEEVFEALESAGKIDRPQRRRLRKQRALPVKWPG